MQKWNDSYYKSIYDYSWDNLETLYPSLKIICEVCLQKNQKSAKKTLTTLFEEKDDLPRGYTLDEDLEPDSDLEVDRDGDGDPTNDIGDGDPTNDDTDGDGIPNYLDSDDTASRDD